MRRLAAIPPLGIEQVDRDPPPAPSALEGLVVFAPVGDMMVAGGTQVRPEAAAVSVGGGQVPRSINSAKRLWTRSPASSGP